MVPKEINILYFLSPLQSSSSLLGDRHLSPVLHVRHAAIQNGRLLHERPDTHAGQCMQEEHTQVQPG